MLDFVQIRVMYRTPRWTIKSYSSSSYLSMDLFNSCLSGCVNKLYIKCFIYTLYVLSFAHGLTTASSLPRAEWTPIRSRSGRALYYVGGGISVIAYVTESFPNVSEGGIESCLVVELIYIG